MKIENVHFLRKQTLMSFLDQNRRTWNKLADGGSQFARQATDEECARPLEILDGRGWLPQSVKGLDVLCLASGGGWQSILYAAAGANVTVVDLSESMLALDHREAERRGYPVKIVCSSMDDLAELGDETFDIVHQPVSTCYVPDIGKVYNEVSRVIRDSGIYISQHKQPTSLQITRQNADDHFVVGLEYYATGPLPPVRDTSYREAGTVEYLHRWEDLVGGLCRTGFVLEDLREPLRADRTAPRTSYKYRGRFIPPYVRLKARRIPRSSVSRSEQPRLWTP